MKVVQNLLASALTLGCFGTSALAQAPAEVRVGTSGTANTVLAIWMADAAGLYAAQNLKVTLSNMGGGSRGAAEVRAGKLDVMHVGLSSVVQLNQKGAELRTIASLANIIRFGFFAVPTVKSAADLKGGTVAISAAGSESDAVATIALERLKLTRKDVELKEYGDSLKRLNALKAGEIKATMLNEPFATAARTDGFRPLVDLAAERIPWLFSTLVVSRTYLNQNRDVLARFLRATAEGNHLALSDPVHAKEVLAKGTRVADPKIVEITYADFTQMTPLDLSVPRAGAENILAHFPPSVSRNLDDYIDLSVLEARHKEGLFAALEKKYGKR
jgi:ABC-type nitrate/sulfonate/bicarbonate transport system substrate-binding protein